MCVFLFLMAILNDKNKPVNSIEHTGANNKTNLGLVGAETQQCTILLAYNQQSFTLMDNADMHLNALKVHVN